MSPGFNNYQILPNLASLASLPLAALFYEPGGTFETISLSYLNYSKLKRSALRSHKPRGEKNFLEPLLATLLVRHCGQFVSDRKADKIFLGCAKEVLDFYYLVSHMVHLASISRY